MNKLDNLKYWVWLTLTFLPANPVKWTYLNEFSNVREAYEKTVSNDLTATQKEILKKHKAVKLDKCEQLIEYCLNNGIKIYCYEDEDYPQRFRSIFNPPSVLFVLGSLENINSELTLAVIGAREPCDYSVRVASRISYELAKAGTVLISGFALGIDSVAHKSAIEAGSKTIAVIGCGLDIDYPKENSKFKSIIAENGAIISEYPPKTSVKRHYFVARNRLIAALSLGVVIIEAGESSGTLNTAGYALSYGNEIFVVPPHDVFDSRFYGQTKLLRDGATPAFSHTDIMFPYYSQYSHKLKMLNFASEVDIYADEKQEAADNTNKKVKKSSGKPKGMQKDSAEEIVLEASFDEFSVDYESLSPTQKQICEALREGVKHCDQLSVELKIRIETVLSDLTELEVYGYVEAISGKRYRLLNID